MRVGLLRPTTLVDLKRIPVLQVVEEAGGRVRIGGSATHRAVARHPAVRSRLPGLADVLERVGNARVRAMGTLGGNVCFAEPRSDVATALVALDGDVVLASPQGDRTIPVAEFVEGPYTTARRHDELLVRFEVPVDDARRFVYLKHQTMERPTVGVAAVSWDGGRRIRLVVGAVSDRPLVVEGDGGEPIDPAAVAEAVEPVPDLAGSERYKRHVTGVVVARALARLGAAA
jgi:carbon-monoxide dehydrogenase medium subunit